MEKTKSKLNKWHKFTSFYQVGFQQTDKRLQPFNLGWPQTKIKLFSYSPRHPIWVDSIRVDNGHSCFNKYLDFSPLLAVKCVDNVQQFKETKQNVKLIVNRRQDVHVVSNDNKLTLLMCLLPLYLCFSRYS